MSTVQFWNISSAQTAALLTLFVNAADPIDWQRLTMRWTIEAAESKDLSAISSAIGTLENCDKGEQEVQQYVSRVIGG